MRENKVREKIVRDKKVREKSLRAKKIEKGDRNLRGEVLKAER